MNRTEVKRRTAARLRRERAREALANALDVMFLQYGDTPSLRGLLAFEIDQAARRTHDLVDTEA